MKLGHILFDKGYIDTAQLFRALQEQKKSNKVLGEILLKNGSITQEQLKEAIDIKRKRK